MSQAPIAALRNARGQVDRERRRANLALAIILVMMVAFWIGMIVAQDDHVGLSFGLAAVIGSVFVAGIAATRASQESTRVILKAMEVLSEDNHDPLVS